MQVGDLVKWIGYPGSSSPAPVIFGIIVKIWRSQYNDHNTRVDVMWCDGRNGRGLYPQTIEVICEMAT